MGTLRDELGSLFPDSAERITVTEMSKKMRARFFAERKRIAHWLARRYDEYSPYIPSSGTTAEDDWDIQLFFERRR